VIELARIESCHPMSIANQTTNVKLLMN
jgi:hypothetical protein